MIQLHVTDSILRWITKSTSNPQAYLLPVTYVTFPNRLINLSCRISLPKFIFTGKFYCVFCCFLHVVVAVAYIVTNKVKEHICKIRIIINKRVSTRFMGIAFAFKIKREKFEICVLNRNQYHHPYATLCSYRVTEEYPGTNIYNKLFIFYTK